MSRRRPRPDYSRYGPREKAARGRTLLWLVVIVVVVGAVALAAREGMRDAPAPEAASTTTAPAQRLLIREGLRREDVAALLDDETSLSGARYLELTGPGSRGRALAKASTATSLEGFLFPATYEITPQTTVQELVDDQLQAYADNTAAIRYGYASSRNLTRYDVLILASMIEREVAVARERPLVAAVLYNRLREGMRLDIDATVQYALGEWKTELTASDLQIDSPYNTRRYGGIPPGPIASPGADSIRAAARPAQVGFLYYVARNDGTGRHYFSTTPEQFEIDVQRSRANAAG